jgi:capsular polysaccharide biosynthesis protein
MAHLDVRIPERFLVCIPDASIWGSNGLIILPDGSFAAEAIYNQKHLRADRAFSIPTPRRPVRMDGDLVTLLGKFSRTGNYYHWAHDGLLRLHGVLEHVPRSTRFVVPARLQGHQLETLRLLGLRDEQLVRYSGDQVWRCERLWFASLPPSGAEVPEAVAWLRQELLHAAGVERLGTRRRLYLSRRGTRHGRIVNEEELVPSLERHGFEIIQPELMSVSEQIRTFAEAAIVVSPTSSGMTNLMFAPSDTRTLEILEPRFAEKQPFVLWTLAETLGQPFWYVMAQTVPNPTRPDRPDLSLPVSKLERCLDLLCP